MHRLLVIVCLALILAGGCRQGETEGSAVANTILKSGTELTTIERRISLNGFWKFAADPDGIGLPQAWLQRGGTLITK